MSEKKNLLRPAGITAAVILILFATVFLILSYRNGNLLETLEAGSFTFELRGNGKLETILVFENGEKTATVRATSTVGKAGHYGVTVTDLNFDGYPDLMVLTRTSGENRCYSCWVWNPVNTSYKQEEALSSVPNLQVDSEEQRLIARFQETRNRSVLNGKEYFESVDVYSIWESVNGVFTETERQELIYYSESDLYCFARYRIDKTTGVLTRSTEDDRWISPESVGSFVFPET